MWPAFIVQVAHGFSQDKGALKLMVYSNFDFGTHPS